MGSGYRECIASISELILQVKSCGDLGWHLHQTLVDVSDQPGRRVAADPGLPIMNVSPEEAARLMFHHPSQLRSHVGHGTDETSSSKLPGSSETIDTGSRRRSMPSRIA